MDKIVINVVIGRKVSWSVRKFCSKTTIRRLAGSIMKENKAIFSSVNFRSDDIIFNQGKSNILFRNDMSKRTTTDKPDLNLGRNTKWRLTTVLFLNFKSLKLLHNYCSSLSKGVCIFLSHFSFFTAIYLK